MTSDRSEARVPVIGLTGGIGAGKSHVARILADLGCLVVNSDELAHEALRDPQIKVRLRAMWGERIFGKDGEIDRSAVAEIVFSDDVERRRLESIIHPWVESRRRAIFDSAPPSTSALVIDAPLLLEAGIDGQCDFVIFVDADREIRLSRVRRTRGWGDADLDNREGMQIPLDEKRRRADSIISNNGGLASLREQVQNVFEQSILRR